MPVAIVASLAPLAFKESNVAFSAMGACATILFTVDYPLRWMTADLRTRRTGFAAFLSYPITPMAIALASPPRTTWNSPLIPRLGFGDGHDGVLAALVGGAKELHQLALTRQQAGVALLLEVGYVGAAEQVVDRASVLVGDGAEYLAVELALALLPAFIG